MTLYASFYTEFKVKPGETKILKQLHVLCPGCLDLSEVLLGGLKINDGFISLVKENNQTKFDGQSCAKVLKRGLSAREIDRSGGTS